MTTSSQWKGNLPSQYISTLDAMRRLQAAASEAFRRGAQHDGQLLLQRALELHPTDPDTWFARAALLQQLQHPGEAIASYREAIRGRPGFPEAFSNMAVAQRALRQLPEAKASADRALALRPAYPRALNNRGLICLDAGSREAAVADFRSALTLEPRFLEAQHNLATALMLLHRYGEAREAFERLPGDFPHALGNAQFARLSDCDWQGYDARTEAIIHGIANGLPAATPMTFLSMCGAPAHQLLCAQAYVRAQYPPGAALAPRLRADDRRIRVAYLSGDFGEHAVSYLLAGVLERHDRERFEVFAFAWGRRNEGEIRRRIEAAIPNFHPVDHLPDGAVAQMIREVGIDIAVDLAGHTEGQRTGILALRPAPVQVNFLGLPATMGAPYIDYLIADEFVVPADQEPGYAERIVRLQGGFQPNDDRRPPVPPTAPRAALGLADDAFVLCCFNRSSKITPHLFSVWMRLLTASPAAVLWLPATHPAAEANLRREAVAGGVDPHRLQFASQVPYPEYLSRYRHADLFLDTAPFNGGTTVSDALTMGVPVVTLAGQSFSSRMAGSCLQALGLTDLIATSVEQYEEIALSLVKSSDRLGQIRAHLTQARQQHPFFDTDRYRKQLEAAYEQMAARHLQGLPAESFSVGDAAIDATLP